MGPVRCRDSMPILTFSTAVNALNSLMFWKVRAIPSRLTACGFLPKTWIGLRPSSRTSPLPAPGP